jgi:hypothetical protein
MGSIHWIAAFFAAWIADLDKVFGCKNFVRKFSIVLTEVCVKVKPR